MPDDFDEPETNEELSPRDLRSQLAERAREAEQLRQELEATKREAEFSKALGDKTSDGWVKYFQAGYDGPLEADAIRKAASDAGFLGRGQREASPNDLSAHARMASAADGAGGGAQVGWQEALAEAGRLPMGAPGSPEEEARTAAILDVVERFGGTTSRSAQ